MKRGFLLSIVSAVAVLGMLTLANAGSVDWQYFTHPSVVGMGPGTDLLMGNEGDALDAKNTPGAYSLAALIWDPANAQCPADSIAYMTGIEVDCLGAPSVTQFTATYLDARQTEPMPGAGQIQVKLTPNGSPNTGNACGLGIFQATKDTTMYMGGVPILPMNDTVVDGKVISATVPVASSYSCPGTEPDTVFAQSYLETIRQLLPPGATYFMVGCAALSFGPNGIPCLNNAVSASTVIAWTNDALNCSSTCCDNDGDDYQAEGTCAGDDCVDTNPNVHPGATERCGNTLDDDCAGDGDAACPPGSCAGGPVQE